MWGYRRWKHLPADTLLPEEVHALRTLRGFGRPVYDSEWVKAMLPASDVPLTPWEEGRAGLALRGMVARDPKERWYEIGPFGHLELRDLAPAPSFVGWEDDGRELGDYEVTRTPTYYDVHGFPPGTGHREDGVFKKHVSDLTDAEADEGARLGMSAMSYDEARAEVRARRSDKE